MSPSVSSQSTTSADEADLLRLARLGRWQGTLGNSRITLSREAGDILQLPLDTLMAMPEVDRRHLHTRVHPSDRRRATQVWTSLAPAGYYEFEYRICTDDGNETWVWERASCNADGEITGVVQDVTEQHRFRRSTQAEAHHDPLTGLPNRALLREHLNAAIRSAIRRRQSLAVLFIDLDHFKQVNDVLGHASGDALLRLAAERMCQCLRASDLVARQGGDEFIVVLDDVTHESDAGLVALKIIEALGQPFKLDEGEAYIGASIGISTLQGAAVDAEILLQRSDMALYCAKSAGRDTLRFFDHKMQESVMQRHRLETELRQALARKEFVLHYQPICGFHHRSPLAVEALIRWQHPNGDLRAPDSFIPTAEHSGLIREIGRWVIEEACDQVARWQAAGVVTDLAINVSSRQIPDGLPPDWLEATLASRGIEPSRLVLEMTESVLIDDSTVTHQWIERIKAMGIRLAVDDFGTGYASLGYLRTFRFDTIKIDKSLILDMCRRDEHLALVKSIIDIGRNMGLEVLAEGVEDLDTFRALRRLGCHHAQGFHLARPAAPEAIGNVLMSLASPPHRFMRWLTGRVANPAVGEAA